MSKKYTGTNVTAWTAAAALGTAASAWAMWPDNDEDLVAKLEGANVQLNQAQEDLQNTQSALERASAEILHLQDVRHEANEDLAATNYAIGYVDGKAQNYTASYSAAACETYAVLQSSGLYKMFKNKVLAYEEVQVEVLIAKPGMELDPCIVFPQAEWLEEELSKLTHGP